MCIIYVGIAGEELHKPDFTSLEKGVVVKMSEMIEQRPVAIEAKQLDLLDRGVYENP